jgi:hypothetical protein
MLVRGELDVEHLVRRYVGDRRGIVASRQHVKTVETDAQGGVIDASNDAPGILVRVHTPPRDSLIGEPDAPFLSALRERMQLFERQVVVVDAGRGPRRAADEHPRTQIG